MHTRPFPHPFVAAYDLPTVERDGGTGAVMADGASYREIMDTADWDRSVVTNVPGQSGQPESEFYGNLLPLWDKGEYFPMLYSRAKVDQNTVAQADAEAVGEPQHRRPGAIKQNATGHAAQHQFRTLKDVAAAGTGFNGCIGPAGTCNSGIGRP